MGSPDNPLRQRARELGIQLVEREWIPSSRRAHECTEYARAEGKLEPFHAAVLHAYWSEGRDLHDWAVLEEAARKAALDPAAMRAAVEAGAWKAAVDARVAAAHELGIHAVPTFVIERLRTPFGSAARPGGAGACDRFVVQGAQTLDVFERVIARLTSA